METALGINEANTESHIEFICIIPDAKKESKNLEKNFFAVGVILGKTGYNNIFSLNEQIKIKINCTIPAIEIE